MRHTGHHAGNQPLAKLRRVDLDGRELCGGRSALHEQRLRQVKG